MSITMYDSTNPFDIPAVAEMVGGYINGSFSWSAAGWGRFAGAEQRHITVAAVDAGDTLDVERGDAFPWEAPDWCAQRRAAGVLNVWVYVQASNWPATRTEFLLRGMPEPSWWIADYDGVPVIPPGAVAKQYANQLIIPGQPHYDLSIVSDSVFGGGGGGIFSAHSQKTEDSDMAIVAHPTIPDRLDLILIGTDKQVYHLGGTAAQLVAGATQEAWGGVAAAGTLSASWSPDGQVLSVSVAGPDGKVYLKQVGLSGAIVQDWRQVPNAAALLPVGTVGPPGPQGVPGPAGSPGPPGPQPKTAAFGY